MRFRILSWVYWPFGFMLLFIDYLLLIYILLYVWKIPEQAEKKKGMFITIDIWIYTRVCM